MEKNTQYWNYLVYLDTFASLCVVLQALWTADRIVLNPTS